ncbi:sigma-70 family RNA polymerase sigma factor [Demequina muriae]|uniref:Sigma-70 family RNA polymerase sigma factor n=1 Tax=Demequina muriae TaxID=3051664 RepID=A0ABT8GEA8_9MICO|nr:sigma-70 family RNA polymerase sigma factor [Demequina sp. EGI L300058]MDN4479763.1 sigma-70 family RNA polymerase sigma factor [Demequina sp. EGI L300058]
MNAAVRPERRSPMERRHLHAVSDDVPRVSRHEPDASAAQRLDDLLVASGRGSAQAFEGVYAAMATPVYRLALRIVRDPGMAEDIAQEALVEAWRKAPEFQPGRGSAKTWMLTIAHRRAVDRVRREQRQRQQMEAEAAVAEREEMPADQDTVVEVDFRRWQSERVRGALDTLTDIQREAIELAYYGGCTQTEVAARLGVPLGTTKTRIRDGMKRLRDALEEG